MEHILILKTSVDLTMKRLLEELQNADRLIDCMIQTSQLERYQALYPNISFIDIQSEGFYDLTSDVMDKVRNKKYDRLFITLSGQAAHNYGNVMAVVAQISSKETYFYNCNGDKVQIPPPNLFKDVICRIYIEFVSLVYSRKGEV